MNLDKFEASGSAKLEELAAPGTWDKVLERLQLGRGRGKREPRRLLLQAAVRMIVQERDELRERLRGAK